MWTRTGIATLFCGLLSTAVGAADNLEAQVSQSDIDIIIELGFGGKWQPEYEGSDDYELSPWPTIGIGYVALPGLFTIGTVEPDRAGLSFGPAFNYISERNLDDDPDLFGLDEVDSTFEAGIGARYQWTHAEVWGEVRYAFGGAEGFVGEFGANAVVRPVPELELKLGPFASAASGDYMQSYFGVSPEEAANTGFRVAPYDADGGFKTAGLKGSARYEFRPTWFLNGEASYSKLIGDAGDSPIVEAGDEDQFTLGLGISKKFSLDVF
ncbi:MipA/OmpV family protein [Arvimicrobium flavum]|uniref:MipA/OmpV family protein n=1 Tax=Arvimicrobium flavum TaxID=3393320 RepID=UPI00237A9748|nr:MipA/OmpV family protein [Mesorhizobium shangrilense]